MTEPWMIPGVGPQLERAAAGTDPRGPLVFEFLPPEMQLAEDSTLAADRDRANGGVPDSVELRWRNGQMTVPASAPSGRRSWVPDSVEEFDAAQAAGRLRLGWLGYARFVRDATPTELALLEHLGHEIPDDLLVYTWVSFPTPSVRRREFPQLDQIDETD
ncbi:MAG: hypothetical protein JST91_13270 [Actinobacteria bacterium]|nr:hypothetical protein [Actinomycetota bacterium]